MVRWLDLVHLDYVASFHLSKILPNVEASAFERSKDKSGHALLMPLS